MTPAPASRPSPNQPLIENFGEVRIPGIERFAFLISPIISLINACDAGSCSTNMIEDRFGHFEAYPQSLKIGRQRAAQIV